MEVFITEKDKSNRKSSKKRELKYVKHYPKKLVREICDHYNIKLIYIKRGDKYCKANSEETYIDSCYCTGSIHCVCKNNTCSRPEIEIGLYTDLELKLFGFFHELGHILDTTAWWIDADKNTKYESELNASKIGFEIAKWYGIKFHDYIYKEAEKNALTYKNN